MKAQGMHECHFELQTDSQFSNLDVNKLIQELKPNSTMLPALHDSLKNHKL